MKSLGEDICELLRGVDSNQAQVSILDHLVGKVLPDVDVLGTFSASDNVVAPFTQTSFIIMSNKGRLHSMQALLSS